MCGKAISVSLSSRHYKRTSLSQRETEKFGHVTLLALLFSNNHGTQTDKALLSFSSLKYIIPHGFFLAARPDETAQEDLLKTYVGPEELFIIGKELYIYYTNGIGRSKLSNSLIEKKLKTFGTARNWNTILQLQKLLQH